LRQPAFPDEQKRLISGTVGGTRVICAYMPNGQEVGSDKYDYKLRWLDALAVWLGEELRNTRSSRCAATTTSPPTTATCTTRSAGPADPLLRARARRLPALLGLGLTDSFRSSSSRKRPSRGGITACSASRRTSACASTTCCSPPLAELCSAAGIDRAPRKLERPSDHAPVWAEIGQPA
jgi:exodeoxyribonuclease-3